MINIALDGPSGSGKSSLAKLIAKKRGYIYVDTGALYRSIGLYVRDHNLDPQNTEAVSSILKDITVEIRYVQGEQRVFLCGNDVSDQIRTPEISMYASHVSAISKVREYLLETQRSIARQNDIVMDGRDIGTVILPNANVKIFLTASDEARAKRRYLELIQKGMEVTYQEVLDDIVKRDHNDRSRTVAPAVPAQDATIVDNSDMDLDETYMYVNRIIEEKLGNV